MNLLNDDAVIGKRGLKNLRYGHYRPQKITNVLQYKIFDAYRDDMLCATYLKGEGRGYYIIMDEWEVFDEFFIAETLKEARERVMSRRTYKQYWM